MSNERSYEIIKYLYNLNGECINSNTLSESVGVSSRTIKRYIKELTEEQEEKGYTIISSNRGYALQVTEKELFLEYFNLKTNNNLEEVNASNKNRIIIIALILVLRRNTTTDEISETLYVSRSTVSKDIGEVKRVLNLYNIEILNRPYYGYFTQGSEINKRKFIANYLEEVLMKNIDCFKDMKEINSSIYNKVKQSTTDILVKNDIYKADNQLNLIQKYVYTSIIRLKNDCKVKLDDNEKISLDVNTMNTAKEIINLISDEIEDEISFEELIYISFIIGNSYMDNSLSLENKDLILKDTNLKDLVNEFIVEIKKVMKLDFTKDLQLKNGLVSHINASLGRYSINTSLDNPMMNIIKTRYIESYNCALVCNEIIKKEFGLILTEDDIGYIALHFAAAMERRRGYVSKVCIICENGIGFSQLIKSKLEEKIANIQVVTTIPRYMLASLDKNDYDLIITTVEIDEASLDTSVIKINYDLDENDIVNIKTAINRAIIVKEFFKKVPEELFFKKAKYNTKEELLEDVLSRMVEKEYISIVQVEDILKREGLSETVINEVVALPHCIKTGENIGAIVMLDKPIKWGSKNVNLVIICCINTELGIEKKLFPMINRVTKDKDKLKNIINAANIDELSINFSN